MDTDSFVFGLVVSAIIAVFWHRDVIKKSRRDYAEMRARWLTAEYDAEVVRSEGDWFVVAIENQRKVIMFLEDESQLTKLYAKDGWHVYARKWKNDLGHLNDGPIWDEKHFPQHFKDRK